MNRSLFALFNLTLIFAAAFVGMRLYRRRDPDSARCGARGCSAPTRAAWYFSNLEPFEELFARLGVQPDRR